ncbi:MAG TPA: efflux RND transporter periplasmic adaptor subunit [Vicinamibacterales bacterium]|nr:efflux RND transporter periplasmic adaptor subunit [Vicinamibacterales bacterium]
MVVLGSVAFLGGCGHAPVEEIETTAPVPVTAEAAAAGTLESVVTMAGTVTPAPGGDLLVTAPEAGRIAEMPRAEGDAVSAGDVLVRFDIPSLAADVDAKRAALKQAQARLESARANAARLAPLVERGVTAQRDLEDARRAQAEAEAEVSQAESAAQASNALSARAVVRAPFDGVIAKRWHNPGDFVEASASDPVIRLINPKNLQIVASAPVADLARLTPGRKGRAIGPGAEESDVVTVLTRPAQVDPKTTLADLRLGFAAGSRFPVGAPLTIEIVTESHANVIVIPAVAVRRDGDETFVMIAGADNKAHKRPVKTGLTSAEKIEIISGVAAGDLVITHGQDELPDNAAVAIAR